jgi:DNA-binding IclR family transcriptional regulator
VPAVGGRRIRSFQIQPAPVHAAHRWHLDALSAKLTKSKAQGYATAFEEYFHGDLSVAAPILDARGAAYGAINIGVSCNRYTSEEAEERFAPLVIVAAHSISLVSGARR